MRSTSPETGALHGLHRPARPLDFDPLDLADVAESALADELARRMQVLIDGRSSYLPPFGGVNWADLPLLIEDIERTLVAMARRGTDPGAEAVWGRANDDAPHRRRARRR